MKTRLIIIAAGLVAVLSAGSSRAVEAPQLINYQGVLRDASDLPRSGDFDMAFRFFDSDGDPGCPAAGGLLLITDRHWSAGTGAVTATGGLFNVALGSGELVPGEATTLNDVFRGRREVWLEVEVGGETLCPRTRVLSSAYAIGAARESAASLDSDADTVPDLTLYVDGTLGLDANDGLTAGTAKATLGAAVRAIPAVLNSDVNVIIAAGEYRERLYLSRRGRTGQYFVRLIGPDGSPPAVVIRPPLDEPIPPPFDGGIIVSDDLTELRNLWVDGFSGDAVAGFSGGFLAVADCELSNSQHGLWVGAGQEAEVSNVTLSNNNIALETDNGRVFVQGIEFINNSQSVNAERISTIEFENGSCQLDSAMGASAYSQILNFGSCIRNGLSCQAQAPSNCCTEDADSRCLP